MPSQGKKTTSSSSSSTSSSLGAATIMIMICCTTFYFTTCSCVLPFLQYICPDYKTPLVGWMLKIKHISKALSIESHVQGLHDRELSFLVYFQNILCSHFSFMVLQLPGTDTGTRVHMSLLLTFYTLNSAPKPHG